MNLQKLIQPIVCIVLVTVFFIGCDNSDQPLPDITNDFTPCVGPPSGQTTTPGRGRALIAYSANGLDFNRPAAPDDGIVIERAGVPDAILLPSGRILVYFMDGCRPPDTVNPENTGITLALSDKQGAPGSWILKNVRFFNKPANFGPGVDPNVVLQPDGNLRLFVTMFQEVSGTVQAGAYSFLSTDGGFTYYYEGMRYNDITDPENYRFSDTNWQLFSGGPRGYAISTDGGHTFETIGWFKPPEYQGCVHEIAETEKPGEYRAYFSTSTGIKSFHSTTAPWTTWIEEPGYRLQLDLSTGLESCEVAVPTVLKLGPGNYIMIYLTVFPGCGCEEDPVCP